MDTAPNPPSSSSKKNLKTIIGHVLMIVAALIAVRITMSVPQFADQYKEAPFHPPVFTTMVVQFYPALLILAVAVVIATVWVAWQYRSVAPPAWVLIVLTIVIGAQVLIVGLAMMLPMASFMKQYLGSQ